ncbi:MAG: HNH endonuclease signature motif containing protein [Chthoniobacterales bacterium]
MAPVSRVLVVLCFLWDLCAFAQQPTLILPDSKLTPGDMFDVTIQDICIPGYSRKVRAVPRALRTQAYRKYGITSANPGDYQLDHLIPLSLGGSNSIRNLWPQSYLTSPWNAHVKDVLERRLHNLVCNGKVDLQTAQHEIATDWIKAYEKYIAKIPPASETREVQFAPETATESEVWVNTRSGKYFKPGSRYYGKTKQGKFMTEIDALDSGYLPAGGTGR